MANKRARFVASGPNAQILKDLGLPEVAFIGRSNVGKSTLLGNILGQPKLVRTSRTPGRTQLLNLFLYAEKIALVDMPGYGYAKLSKSKRNELDKMVQGYLRNRKNIHGVVQVIDARRVPVSTFDQYVSQFILEQGHPLLLAITKIDQIPKNRRLHQIRSIETQLGVPKGAGIACSGMTGEGKELLLKKLWELTE